MSTTLPVYLLVLLTTALCLAVGTPPANAQTVEWARQIGTSEFDSGTGISVDGMGSIYVTGSTEGNLAGASAGGSDAFVSKYDANGNLDWTRQLGTFRSEFSTGVSADRLGNVYISGRTSGSLGGPHAGGIFDAFVSKYDADGNLDWTRQLGTSSHDAGYAISADGMGNVFLSGDTSGTLDGAGSNVSSSDAFVSKYDADGNLDWTRQLGSSGFERSTSVSADRIGNVFIAGFTEGNLAGTLAGGSDAFVSKYDADGNLAWTRQLGTSGRDSVSAASADGMGTFISPGSQTVTSAAPTRASSTLS